MAPDVLPDFQAWMASVGIEVADSIRLTGTAAGALGIQAVRDIAEGERLCTIPKAACISVRTTELADVIEAAGLGGGLGLVLAVLHEMSLGQRSKWYGYFKALQRREYLPLFWSAAQLELLRGTELEGKVEADSEAAAEDFEEHVAPLLAAQPGRLDGAFVTLENFRVAASFVASRAFGVDEWHGDAMVPLADIFNHKASVVELGEGYQVHGADDSSDEGDDGGDGDDDDEAEEEEEERGQEGEGPRGGSEEDVKGSGSGSSQGQEAGPAEAEHGHRHKRHRHAPGGACCGAPGHDHSPARQGEHDCGEHQCRSNGHEHAPEKGPAGGAGGYDEVALPAVMGGGAARIYGLESANGLHLRLQMGIVDRDEDTLEIVAASAVASGAEVHNTYGELGNAELVKKYGFALRQNPFTAVGLDKRRLLAAARAALGPRRWKARAALLRDQTEVLDEDEEPFEALPNGHISPALYVALRVLGASDAELASWRSIGDALCLPPAVAGSASSDGVSSAEGGAAQGSREMEEEDEEDEGDEEEGGDEEAQLSAVQVWRVLDTDGQPLPEAEATVPPSAGAAAAAAEAAPAGAGSRGRAELLPAVAWQLLAGEVRQRQAAYATKIEADLRKLARLEARQAGRAEGPPGEAQQAERAALLLRVTEKEVLRDLLAALQRRLAHLGSAETEAAVAVAEEAAGAAPAGQGRAKPRGRAGGRPAAAAGAGGRGAGSTAARKRKQR